MDRSLMKDFLLEIFSEEIPAGMQEQAQEQLVKWLDKEITPPFCARAKKSFVGRGGCLLFWKIFLWKRRTRGKARTPCVGGTYSF